MTASPTRDLLTAEDLMRPRAEGWQREGPGAPGEGMDDRGHREPEGGGGGVTERVPRIDFDREALAALCRKWHITKLAFFGSVMRDDFGPDSDIDLLYEFEEGYTLGLGFVDMIEDFAAFFGRTVDMVAFNSIDRRLKKCILADAQVQYVAA